MGRSDVVGFGFAVELETGIVDQVDGMLGRLAVVDLCFVVLLAVEVAVVVEAVVGLGQVDVKRKMTVLMYQIADLLVQGLGSY